MRLEELPAFWEEGDIIESALVHILCERTNTQESSMHFPVMFTNSPSVVAVYLS